MGRAYCRLIGEKPLPSDEEAPAGTDAAQGVIDTARSNIEQAAAMMAGGDPSEGDEGETDAAAAIKDGGATLAAAAREAAGSEAAGGEAGIAIKEQGVKVDGGPSDALGADGEPVPGLEVTSPGGAAVGIGPVTPTPTDPGDPLPPDSGPGGGGEATAGVQPIPGVDITVKQTPPR